MVAKGNCIEFELGNTVPRSGARIEVELVAGENAVGGCARAVLATE